MKASEIMPGKTYRAKGFNSRYCVIRVDNGVVAFHTLRNAKHVIYVRLEDFARCVGGVVDAAGQK